MTAKETYDVWCAKVTDEEKKELVGMDDEEIKERFSAPLAFGTAGMRGTVGLGTYKMNAYTVARATSGLAKFILSLGKKAAERGVVVSFDTRRFSKEFSQKTAAVLSAYGVKAYLFGTVHPVPMCSYAVRKLNAIAGVMITASHNPKEYNGYKVYGEDGAQMGPEDTATVVKYINASDYFDVKCEDIVFPDLTEMDNVKIGQNITVIGKTVDDAYYNEIMKLSLSPEAVEKCGAKLKLVYTPIHGSGYVPVTTILEKQGINVTVVKEQALPDTEFSTVPIPNPENPAALAMGIELGDKIGADVVIGTDPDCDRMGLAVRDDSGKFRLLNGNQIGVLLLDYIITRLKESGKMPKNPAVVKTIVTTTLADRLAKKNGVAVFNVLTGFKFIGEKIKEWEASGEYEYIFGFEESYGSLRGTHARDKDAVVASMLTAEMVCYYQTIGKGLFSRLQEIFSEYGYYKEAVTSIAYKGVGAMAEMAAVMKKLRAKTVSSIAGEKVESVQDILTGEETYPNGSKKKLDLPTSDVLKYCLKDEQFVCVRPSGTEPKLKVYVLCFDENEEKASRKASDLLEGIKKEL